MPVGDVVCLDPVEALLLQYLGQVLLEVNLLVTGGVHDVLVVAGDEGLLGDVVHVGHLHIHLFHEEVDEVLTLRYRHQLAGPASEGFRPLAALLVKIEEHEYLAADVAETTRGQLGIGE